MRWTSTFPNWPTLCLRGPPTPAGWLCLSPSSPHTISWSMVTRWAQQNTIYILSPFTVIVMVSCLIWLPSRSVLSSTWPPGIHYSTSVISWTKVVYKVNTWPACLCVTLNHKVWCERSCSYCSARLRHVHVHQEVQSIPEWEGCFIQAGCFRLHKS